MTSNSALVGIDGFAETEREMVYFRFLLQAICGKLLLFICMGDGLDGIIMGPPCLLMYLDS